jgi:hypothetical protein
VAIVLALMFFRSFSRVAPRGQVSSPPPIVEGR